MIARAANRPEAAQPQFKSLAAIVSGDACAANGSHDCCAKKKAAATRQTNPSQRTAKPSLQIAALISQTTSVDPQSNGRITECPLALSRAVALTKTSDRREAAAVALPIPRATVVAPIETHEAISPVARLPNRGHTYLRCCVFLI